MPFIVIHKLTDKDNHHGYHKQHRMTYKNL